MLKQNDVLISQHPLRFNGGAAAGQSTSARMNFNHTETGMNRYFGNAISDDTASYPLGYSGIYAIIESVSPSGLAASTGLTGASNVSATAIMIGQISNTSNGTSNVSTSYIYGKTSGSISSNINVGASLTANSVAGAVMGAIIEGAYSLQNVLKVIAAVNAGQVSGGPTSPVFKGISGASNVVSGTVDSNGNRTGVVINP